MSFRRPVPLTEPLRGTTSSNSLEAKLFGKLAEELERVKLQPTDANFAGQKRRIAEDFIWGLPESEVRRIGRLGPKQTTPFEGFSLLDDADQDAAEYAMRALLALTMPGPTPEESGIVPPDSPISITDGREFMRDVEASPFAGEVRDVTGTLIQMISSKSVLTRAELDDAHDPDCGILLNPNPTGYDALKASLILKRRAIFGRALGRAIPDLEETLGFCLTPDVPATIMELAISIPEFALIELYGYKPATCYAAAATDGNKTAETVRRVGERVEAQRRGARVIAETTDYRCYPAHEGVEPSMLTGDKWAAYNTRLAAGEYTSERMLAMSVLDAAAEEPYRNDALGVADIPSGLSTPRGARTSPTAPGTPRRTSPLTAGPSTPGMPRPGPMDTGVSVQVEGVGAVVLTGSAARNQKANPTAPTYVPGAVRNQLASYWKVVVEVMRQEAPGSINSLAQALTPWPVHGSVRVPFAEYIQVQIVHDETPRQLIAKSLARAMKRRAPELGGSPAPRDANIRAGDAVARLATVQSSAVPVEEDHAANVQRFAAMIEYMDAVIEVADSHWLGRTGLTERMWVQLYQRSAIESTPMDSPDWLRANVRSGGAALPRVADLLAGLRRDAQPPGDVEARPPVAGRNRMRAHNAAAAVADADDDEVQEQRVAADNAVQVQAEAARRRRVGAGEDDGAGVGLNIPVRAPVRILGPPEGDGPDGDDEEDENDPANEGRGGGRRDDGDATGRGEWTRADGRRMCDNRPEPAAIPGHTWYCVPDDRRGSAPNASMWKLYPNPRPAAATPDRDGPSGGGGPPDGGGPPGDGDPPGGGGPLGPGAPIAPMPPGHWVTPDGIEMCGPVQKPAPLPGREWYCYPDYRPGMAVGAHYWKDVPANQTWRGLMARGQWAAAGGTAVVTGLWAALETFVKDPGTPLKRLKTWLSGIDYRTLDSFKGEFPRQKLTRDTAGAAGSWVLDKFPGLESNEAYEARLLKQLNEYMGNRNEVAWGVLKAKLKENLQSVHGGLEAAWKSIQSFARTVGNGLGTLLDNAFDTYMDFVGDDRLAIGILVVVFVSALILSCTRRGRAFWGGLRRRVLRF